VNRPEIIQQAIGGLGAPAIGWYTPDVEWAYNTAARVPDFDLDAAQRSLRAAGLPLRGGHRLRASLIVANAAHHREIGMTLRRQFAAIGVRLDVEPVATPELPKRVIESRDFDLALLAGGQGPDPDQLRRRFLADTESGAFIGYDAADFREAVERGARAVDVADRAAAYHRAQEILARDVPFIPIAESVKVVVHSRRVSGLPQLEARGLVGVFDFSLVKLGPRSANATR
jgi:ABC-type transport system substrate-binding protein